MMVYILDGDLLKRVTSLGGGHHLGCGLNQHTLGIEPRSRNSHPTLIAIRPRSHERVEKGHNKDEMQNFGYR